MSLFKIFKGKAVNLPTDMHDGYAYFTTDDGKFYIDALVDGILKRTLINPTDDATGKVKSATVAEWAQQTSLISEKDVIYVYTDHQTDDGKNIPGIKIGDGLTYVVDLPFVDTIYMKHITDTDIHITAEERAKWNKVNSAVPNTRTVNGKALSSDISLGAGDVGAYTKSETDTKINAAVASTYKYKGSVTADKLPTSGQVVGDVYNITNDSSYGKAGMNVAWNGTTWDALGSNVDLSNYVTTSDSRLSNARPASDVYAWAKAASKPSYSASEIGAAPASHTHTKDQVGLGNVANLDQSKAIKSITRNGTTFTATALDGTTSTFTQQDVNATYGVATSSADGLMSKSDKAKLDGIGAGSNVKSVNGKTGAVTLSKADVGLGNVDNTADKDKSVKSADTADSIKTYADGPTSANKLFGDGKLRYFLATASMTEGKPTLGDAQVLDLAWGTQGGWDEQLAVTHGGSLQIRTMHSGTWGPWITVYDENHKPTPSDVGLGNVDNTADKDKSVKYAASAGSANSVAWSNVSGRPTNLNPEASSD